MVKGDHKKQAHRLLRRKTKQALRDMDDDNDPIIPQAISTGYKT